MPAFGQDLPCPTDMPHHTGSTCSTGITHFAGRTLSNRYHPLRRQGFVQLTLPSFPYAKPQKPGNYFLSYQKDADDTTIIQQNIFIFVTGWATVHTAVHPRHS